MKRDRMTFAMMIGIPILQLILFGYAINTDPKHLPTAVVSADYGPFSRALMSALQISEYFRLVDHNPTEEEAADMLLYGDVQFVISIPENFNRAFLRGERPQILVQADATDPSAVGNALAALNVLIQQVYTRDLQGALSYLQGKQPPADFVVHSKYNPEKHTQYNIVPGLLGVILTMTMVFITALAITREKERGTMENLLATPVRPFEVMAGKIVPYIMVGYVQMSLVLCGAVFLFNVPIMGSLVLLYLASLVFIAANLAVGVTFSTIAQNQLQAVQMSIFFFLPSILLSGFMFPFRGMPLWAQYVGSILPLRHYLPIVRGILLKGNTLPEIMPHVIPLMIFLLVVLIIGVNRYRQTLD